MPRDDLSIDFVHKMPPAEALDPGLVLDDWINRVQNLPEEIRFIHDEILEKDRLFNECVRGIEERDAKIQKFIRSHGSLEPNPKEDALYAQVRERYATADKLSAEKMALAQKMQATMDKHLRILDIQIKQLYDRGEPGFLNPDELPSLLRPSAANHSAPSAAAVNPSASVTLPPISASPNPTPKSAGLASARLVNPLVRNTQAHFQHAASAPATPSAASMLLSRHARQDSVDPPPSKRPRTTNTGLGLQLPGPINTATSAVTTAGRLSFVGPGTPKGGVHTTAAVTGHARSGTFGPRPGSIKGLSSTAPSSRRGTPGATSTTGRKKLASQSSSQQQLQPQQQTKSAHSRLKKATNRTSASAADSEISEADSPMVDDDDDDDDDDENEGAGDDDEDNSAADSSVGGLSSAIRPSTPTTGARTFTAGAANGGDDETMPDIAYDETNDEANDDKKYCICQTVSYGPMVACDNETCPYEWFHMSCVGLKSVPNGEWFCPLCSQKKS